MTDDPSAAWIQTFTGKAFHVLAPSPSEIDVEDIAHALSLTCRFGGHCTAFYSVAQHSVLVSEIVEREAKERGESAETVRRLALEGLLHDAAEAYVGDVPTPIKKVLDGFHIVEDRVLAVIFERFGLRAPYGDAVTNADVVALVTEKRDLMVPEPKAWSLPEGVVAVEDRVVPLSPAEAKAGFLVRFRELG